MKHDALRAKFFMVKSRKTQRYAAEDALRKGRDKGAEKVIELRIFDIKIYANQAIERSNFHLSDLDFSEMKKGIVI